MSMGMCVNKGTPTMIFVSYTSNVDCMCECKLYKMKVQTIQNISCNFREKIKKKLQNVNILGVRFHSSGTSIFSFKRKDLIRAPVHKFV